MPILTSLRARVRGTRVRRSVAAVTALAVMATFLQANPSPVTAAPRDDRPAVQPDGKAAPARPVQATEGSAQGNFGATSLAPASKWSVMPSSGSFSWSYPLRVPPVPGGFGPGVSFGYNSQAVDGRTAATNNQGSWIGEGFGYEPGYVERRYKPCQDDGHKEVGDLCWAYDNAVLSLNGASSELIRVGSTWKMANDDGSKIEKLTGAVNGDANDGTSAGEHWKITTSDGAQYFFGLNRLPGWAAGKEETKSAWTVPVFGDDAANNDDKLPGATAAPKEPCYNATFANAWCQQAWRWNLDYAIDRHGNAMSYYYDKETNSYAKSRKTDVNGTAYDRGGSLKRIDYGLRTESLWTAAAAARVHFTPAERCDPDVNATACAAGNLTAATKDAWPDVPFDRICATGVKCKADQVSPTFFTRKRLSTVTTEIRTGAASWTPIDKWTLGHLYPDNGDGSRGLWLHTISQDGVYGGGTPLTSPAVRLDVKQLPNRILKPGSDMLGRFVRPRVGVIYNDTGGQIDIEYAAPDCSTGDLPAEGDNTRRCFPIKWHGAGSEAVVTDWFNKYVVRAVRETDTTDVEPGTQLPPDMVTFYDYLGDAAWRYPDPDGMSEAKYKTCRLTAVWLPDRDRRGEPNMKYTYVTDPGKPVVVKTAKAGRNANDPSVEFQIYDGFMRPRQVQTEGPAKSDGTPGRLVADTWYTSTGQVDRVSEPYYADGAPSGGLLPTLDVDTDRQTRYLYDGADRVTSTLTMSAGQEKWRSTVVYEGDRTHVTPPAGGVATTSITDAGGNVEQRWHYKGSTPSGEHDTTKYTYTPAGQLSTVTDPDDNVWKYHYDQLGRKTRTEDPDAGKTSYTYDKVDRLTSTTDARERRIDTEYDVLGRATRSARWQRPSYIRSGSRRRRGGSKRAISPSARACISEAAPRERSPRSGAGPRSRRSST